jgi:5-hydroxyisourate hydrolase
MSLVTTHVLDTAQGRPAAGIAVRFETAEGSLVAEGVTDVDGRIRDLGPETLAPGVFRLVFDTGAYLGPDAFFPEVALTFRVGADAHYHVPLLLSPFACSTYRGS